MSFSDFMDKLTLVPKELHIVISGHERNPEEHNYPFVTYSVGFKYYRESELKDKDRNSVHDLLSGPLGRFKIGELEHHLHCVVIPLLLEKPRACVEGHEFSMELKVSEKYVTTLLDNVSNNEKELLAGNYDEQISELDPENKGELSLWLVLALCGKEGTELTEFFNKEKQFITSKPESYHIAHGYQLSYIDASGVNQKVALDLKY